MGLDCVWNIRLDNQHRPAFEPPLNLCGGLLSGNGEGSFRGKVYNEFIQEMTGHSLYSDLSADDVADIADKLEALPEDTKFSGLYEISNEAFHDLRRMFRAYALIGAGLFAWY